MLTIQAATDTLRATLLKKGVENHVQDAFDNLSSYLILLNSSSPSVQMLRKLSTVLRRPLLPLYNACLQPALQLLSTVLSTALGKLCNADNVEDESLRAAWDATAEVILSGILDFLDQKDRPNAESDDAVWEALYRVITEFFFPDYGRGLPAFSIPLCLSAYNTLTEVAARHIAIRNAFRQNTVFGGERLGVAISRTRGNYLLLEALLLLFARLLPPTNNTSQGKLRRAKFVQEVLGSPKLFKCTSELLDIMQKTSGTHWDDVAAQIIDVLARTDITFPQPFSIDEIHVCGRVFPQPLATDRLVMDRKAFLANIVAENDDVCESLEVPYSHIRAITLDSSEKTVPKGNVLIVVYLTSPPLVANVEMNSPGASHLHAKFMLQNEAVGRFMEALRRRGVGKLSFLNPLPRAERKCKSISIGSGFKLINDSSPVPPTASFEGKVQHVNQVYKTDVEDQTTFQAVPVSRFVDFLPASDSKSPFKDESLLPEALKSAMAQDVPATFESARLITPTNKASQPLQNSALPFFPGNLARTTKSFGDSDELSEISEFEADSNATSKRPAGGGSASYDHRSKPSQHRVDRVRMSENSGATFKGIKKASDPTSKTTDRTEAVAERLPETGALLLTSDSPTFRSSSSTKIDVSPKPLLNSDTLPTTDTEAVHGHFDASQNFVSPRGLTLAKDELGQHSGPFNQPAGADEKIRPLVEPAKDTNVSYKTAGSRRKRVSIKSSSKPIVEVDDEYAPPRKKRREDGLDVEKDKFKPIGTSLEVVPIPRVTKYTKAAKRSSPGVDPVAKTSVEPVGLKTTRQGTRRSSRIKKKQTATNARTWPNGAHNKTQKEKQMNSQSACGVECNRLATVSPQASDVEIDCDTPSTLGSPPGPLVIREFPSPKANSQFLVELGSVETPKAKLPREMPKCNSLHACSTSQPSVTLGKEPKQNLDVAASFGTKRVQERLHVKKEEVVNDGCPASDVRIVDEEVSRIQEAVEYTVSPKEDENLVVIMESETVTIDLTIDDFPARGKSELHKAVIQTKFRSPDLLDSVTMEDPSVVPSPRYRRRSVTFASPIEYVLERKVKSKTQGSSLSYLPPSPSGSSTLSPLRTTSGTVSVRHESPGRITPRATLQSSALSQASIQNQTPDGAEIQNIVEVLNDIQAVIIKDISDKFKNVKKDVQRSRDELIQQVLDELRGMVAENARYFNGLLRLEEDYYRNCKAIIHCWEELIDCNDGIATRFQDALKEHDRTISARTFPKSLLPMQPIFSRRRTNAL